MNASIASPHSDDRMTARAVLITLVCFVISMIDGFDTLMLSFIAPLLAKALSIDHATLGRIFGAGFIGTVAGSLLAWPAADRFGRRPMLILALAVTGTFTLACAFAHSASTLATLRLIAGLGMGGAIPPLAAITAETGPAKRRSSLVILMFIGFPLGAVLGGVITAAIMMQFGWAVVFLMGGTCALTAIALVFLVIPSIPVSRVSHRPADGAIGIARKTRVINPFGNLLADGRCGATLALWCGVLASMILSGFLVSFMPVILNLSGVSPEHAALGAVVINVGAIVGALAISLVVTKVDPFLPVMLGFLGGAALVCVLGRVIGSGNLVFMMLFAVGGFLVGGQLTFPALASRLYPKAVRAAGVGWAMAIGRVGSIIGPVVGGIFLAQHWPLERLFTLASLLALIGSASIGAAYLLRPRDRETVLPGKEASHFPAFSLEPHHDEK